MFSFACGRHNSSERITDWQDTEPRKRYNVTMNNLRPGTDYVVKVRVRYRIDDPFKSFLKASPVFEWPTEDDLVVI